MGAVVTTVKAGMAFADWPTSDGQNMLLYRWFDSSGDKFIEHGHRLAGMMIGLFSIGLASSLWWKEPRRWVRFLGVAVLGCVILQGLLGGARVLENSRTLALVHGQFGAWVFTLTACVALFTSQSWLAVERAPGESRVGLLKPFVVGTVLLIQIQLALGGMLRHHKLALFEHLGFAFVVLGAVVLTAVLAIRTKVGWLRRPAQLLLGLVVAQVLLGAATWITTFGLPQIGYVAVQESQPQVIFATSHAVLAMLVLMTSVVLVLRVYRIAPLKTAFRRAGTFSEPIIIRGGMG
jgi:cytochrome c oxidase assembly protein subunit 15